MMLYPALADLQQAILACRSEAQANDSSPCNAITAIESYGGDKPLITVPLPENLDYEVQVVTLGINPRWSKHQSIPQQGTPTGQTKGPKTFDAYIRTILSGLPDKRIAHLELVQCGTPDGSGVGEVIWRCRERFFDKAIAILKPKLIIPIGQWASQHLYAHNTAAGKAGQPWAGIEKRHAFSDRVSICGHQCNMVYVLQPSRHVSMEKRLAAKDAIARAMATE
jgi:hypothetical protein